MLAHSKITSDCDEKTTKAYVFDHAELFATVAVEIDGCTKIRPSGPLHMEHSTIVAGTRPRRKRCVSPGRGPNAALSRRGSGCMGTSCARTPTNMCACRSTREGATEPSPQDLDRPPGLRRSGG